MSKDIPNNEIVKKNNGEYLKDFSKGIFENNPVFVVLTGLFPSIAVTTSFVGSISLGIIGLITLFLSTLVITLIKKNIPDNLKYPVFLLVIGIFITVFDILTNIFFPKLSISFGIYLPLLVINCFMILESEYLSENSSLGKSLLTSLGVGTGFTLGLLIIGFIREILGKCSIDLTPIGINKIFFSTEPTLYFDFFNKKIEFFSGINIFLYSAGAFFTVGFILAFINYFQRKSKANKD
jgi:Na+-translocating ferredoxin:NAD+ oxidoreductase subunit E